MERWRRPCVHFKGLEMDLSYPFSSDFHPIFINCPSNFAGFQLQKRGAGGRLSPRSAQRLDPGRRRGGPGGGEGAARELQRDLGGCQGDSPSLSSRF